jgi:hypothetical protein
MDGSARDQQGRNVSIWSRYPGHERRAVNEIQVGGGRGCLFCVAEETGECRSLYAKAQPARVREWAKCVGVRARGRTYSDRRQTADN